MYYVVETLGDASTARDRETTAGVHSFSFISLFSNSIGVCHVGADVLAVYNTVKIGHLDKAFSVSKAVCKEVDA